MLRYGIFLLLTLLLSCGERLPARAPIDPAFREPIASGSDNSPSARTILVGGDYAYAPFEYLDADGKPAGFNIDLLRRIAQVMDLTVRIELGPWDEVRGKLERGELDMLAGMYKTPERDRSADFTIPHFITTYGIFARNAPDISAPSDLPEKRVAVQTGDVAHDHLLKRGYSGEIVEFRTWEDIFVALLENKADYAVASMVQAMQLFQERRFRDLRRVGPPLLQERYCMAVREGDAELLAALNEGLNILKASGEYDRIYETWFGVFQDMDAGHRRLMAFLYTAVGVLCFLGALTVAWTAMLRRQVRLKTAALSRELAAKEEAQRNLEAAAREADRLRLQAEESNKSKSVFLAGISHELRTPLHGVIGMGRLLERSTLSDDQRRTLGMLQGAAGQLERLITDLLDLTRAATGKLSLAPETIPLGKLAEWTEDPLRRQAEEKGLTFSFMIDDPTLQVRADGGRLIQIILNLANNAIRYTERGTVSVRLSYADGRLTIRVADNGRGIAPEERERIFEAFYQIRQQGNGPRPGLGLGLSIVKALTDLMNGEIDVSSGETGGSVFIVFLPLERRRTPAEKSPFAAPALPGKSPKEVSLEGLSVLITEDETINALYLRRILAERGAAVQTARDGATAVRKCAEEQFGLIMMDMGLPVLDGLEATRRIRLHEAERGRPRAAIIALTANASEQDREACREAGMDGFLSKPFVERALWAEIRRVLEAPVDEKAPATL